MDAPPINFSNTVRFQLARKQVYNLKPEQKVHIPQSADPFCSSALQLTVIVYYIPITRKKSKSILLLQVISETYLTVHVIDFSLVHIIKQQSTFVDGW